MFPPDAITYWVTPAGVAYASKNSQGRVDRKAAGTFGAVLGDLLIILGGDLQQLLGRYEVSATAHDTETEVHAVPRDPKLKRSLHRLEVVLGSDLVSPKRITIEETDTDRVTIRFERARKNVPVDPARMRPPNP
jgi:hypothetical protein